MKASKELKLKFEQVCSLDLKLDREAAYFSILDCPDGKIRLYYRGEGEWGETHVRESDDGITFSEARIIWKNSCICHNFSPFIHNGEYYAVGGLDFVHKRIKAEHDKGLYLLHSKDGVSWRLVKDEPIITLDHPGFFKAPYVRQMVKVEFDSAISCVHYEDKFYLYFRKNTDKGIRDIQYATSDNLIDWSEVRPVRFKPEFNAAQGQNLYASYFFNFEDKIMCFIPCYVNKGHGFIAAFEPEGMDRWNFTGWFNKKPVSPPPIRRNRCFPVKGIIRNKKNPKMLHYYVHENYFRAERAKPVTLDLYVHERFLSRFTIMSRLIMKYPSIFMYYLLHKCIEAMLYLKSGIGRRIRGIRRLISSAL